jgi:hypothetical protein
MPIPEFASPQVVKGLIARFVVALLLFLYQLQEEAYEPACQRYQEHGQYAWCVNQAFAFAVLAFFALIQVVVSLTQAERALLNHALFQRLIMW